MVADRHSSLSMNDHDFRLSFSVSVPAILLGSYPLYSK